MHDVYPIQGIRSLFPALCRLHNGNKAVYLDGPGGSQVVSTAITAMSNYMRRGVANTHCKFPSSEETEAIIESAKAALGDLLACTPGEIAFALANGFEEITLGRQRLRTETAALAAVVMASVVNG